jgi:hypothetical protein
MFREGYAPLRAGIADIKETHANKRTGDPSGIGTKQVVQHCNNRRRRYTRVYNVGSQARASKNKNIVR